MRNHIHHVNIKFLIYLFISYSLVVFCFQIFWGNLLVKFARNLRRIKKKKSQNS